MISTAVVNTQNTLNVKSSANRDLEVSTIQAAYNIGGAVVTVSQKSIDGVDYVQGADQKETMFGIKMAF